MFHHSKYLLTTNELTNYINNNDRLNDIFTMEDPDQIANLLLSEINLIINCIAPKKGYKLTKNLHLLLTRILNPQLTKKNYYIKNL